MKLSVRVDQQTYAVEIKDLSARPILATIDGETFEVWPEETAGPAGPRPAVAQPTPTLHRALPSPVEKNRAIVAPIPGVILSIQVKAGDLVPFGQELCILEAMKMKNQIRANRAGKIGEVLVSPGDQVRHGQVLFQFVD